MDQVIKTSTSAISFPRSPQPTYTTASEFEYCVQNKQFILNDESYYQEIIKMGNIFLSFRVLEQISLLKN